jgi:hypothetical protein
MKRFLLFVSLLTSLIFFSGGIVLAGGGSSDAPVDIRISINPTQGDPGESIAVTGTRAKPGSTVFISLSPGAETAEGALVTVEVDPAADGTFSTNLTIPADTEDGIYAIRAEQLSERGNVLQYYWNAVIVGNGGDGPLLPTSGGVIEAEANTGITTLALILIGLLMLGGVYRVIRTKLQESTD